MAWHQQRLAPPKNLQVNKSRFGDKANQVENAGQASQNRYRQQNITLFRMKLRSVLFHLNFPKMELDSLRSAEKGKCIKERQTEEN